MWSYIIFLALILHSRYIKTFFTGSSSSRNHIQRSGTWNVPKNCFNFWFDTTKKKRRERQQMLLLLLNISSIWHSCHPSIFIPSFDINECWLDCGFVVYRTGLTVERVLFLSVLCPCRWEESARLEDRCRMFALQQNIFHGLQFCVIVDVEKPHSHQWKSQPERDRNHLLTHKSWVALHLLWSVWILDVEDILLYTFIVYLTGPPQRKKRKATVASWIVVAEY